MTVSQIRAFCANQQNHESHTWGNPIPFYFCEGVAPMANRFCGDPKNHGPHEYAYKIDPALPEMGAYCDGVGIEKEDVHIEKYDPTEQAMDGTPYSEITITIKHKDGTVTEIHSEKAAFANLEVEYQKYVPLDDDFVTPPPIERVVFAFEPYRHADKPVTIERKSDET